MNNVYTRFSGVVALLLCFTAAQAASVSLVPDAAAVDNGAVLNVDLNFNAPDAPGATPGSFDGIILLQYDPTLVMFEGFSFSDPAVALHPLDPISLGDGTVEVGFQNALNVGTIGTFTFTVLGLNGDVINLSIADADDFFGSFVNTVPTIQPVDPDFNGTSVNVVPIPAAVWLFVSALGLAAGVARRR